MRTIAVNRTGIGRLAFSGTPLSVMTDFLQDTPQKLEAGGAMLGRLILGCNDIVVDEVTVPMPGDRRGRTFFHRGRLNHQIFIDQAWKLSQGTCTYLGEWHTHPEPVPNPSWVDLREWRRKVKEDTYAADALFFVIVGINITRVWEAKRGWDQYPMIGQFATPPCI